MNIRANWTCISASIAVISVCGVALPAVAQESGGLTSTFSIQNQIETTRNPTLTPGNTDTRTIATTDFGYSLNSTTRSSELELVASGQLRYAFGDANTIDEGFDIGAENVSLSYSTQSPRVEIDSFINYSRNDLSYLDTTDLVTVNEGSLSIAEDFLNSVGTGTRQTLAYRAGVQFYRNRPFGWGARVSGTVLDYTDVSSIDLVDNWTNTTSLFAHFDVTPNFRIDTQARLARRVSDGSEATSTSSLSVGATALRADNLEVRGRLTFSAPDSGNDRLAATAGFTITPSSLSTLSIDIGANFSDSYNTQLVGRLSYDVRPISVLSFSAQLNTDVTDTTDNEVVVDTAAIIGVDYELTPVTVLSFDAVYANENNLDTATAESEFSSSLQLSRQLTNDWQMTAGISQTTRSETGFDSARSEAIYFSLGREWTARRQ